MTRRVARIRYSRSGAIVLRRPTRLRRSVAALAVAITAAALGVMAGPRVLGPATAAAPAGSPVGAAERMDVLPGGMRFVGWALDPNTAAPISVYVTVDGVKVSSELADGARADIAKSHPSAGPNHGFTTTTSISEGAHTICVWAKNVAAGADTKLRCQTRTLDYGPVGAAEHIQLRPGSLWVSGWAFDYDDPTAPVTINVAIDNSITRIVASDSRPDIAKAYPTAGAAHGFSKIIPIAQGKHTACVRAQSIGFGASNSFRCATFVLNESPVVGINTIGSQAGKLRVAGWTYDPDAATSPLTVTTKIDAITHSIVANGVRNDLAAKVPKAGPNHGFDNSYALAEGTHRVCVTARNVSFGSNTSIACRDVLLSFTPTAALTALTATSTGATVSGWATDPDTASAISVTVTVDGRTATTIKADRAATTHSGHSFTTPLALKSGTHTVCAIGLNVVYGTHNSKSACRSITLALKPIGRFDTLTRAAGSSNLAVTGWAIDPDTTSAVSVAVSLDATALPNVRADASRPDVGRVFPAFGPNHGIAPVLTADESEHTVCLTAKNVGGGADVALGCKVINAVNPVAPGAPRSVTAVAAVGSAKVSWIKPASDGGAPWTSYTVTASPGGPTLKVAATVTSVTVTSLKANTTYTFTVQATNVAGTSVAGTSRPVRTPSGVPAQTTPAPVSTSRYIRNIRSAAAAELSVMRAEGRADALANPSGHRYLILLDIGGQDQVDGGVVLSATTRFVSYANLLKCVQAYVDGYHSGQRASAPVTIAIGTNNDMDVNAASGAAWATKVVNPVVTYARKYPNLAIAGANDVEPGFRASYSATKSWLSGYLGATSAKFVFNGSADGCAWTVTSRSCNNGWTMAGLYYLAAGAAPTRMQNLPQIYNYTMADQWKFISLTGVAQRQPRINFAGTLTEWTACAQTNSCGSITGRTAWAKMWTNLQSDVRLKVGSLPYATDLRIDR
jgi:hypothetical protein